MVSRWRRVFCTSIPPEPDSSSTHLHPDHDHDHSSNNSSTATPNHTTSSNNTSWPRSRSPSPFRLLKSGLGICTRRCGLCLQSVKKGKGMATFTAECAHNFHFPCISDYVKTQGSLACPVCSCLWKEMPTLSVEMVEYDQHKQLFDEGLVREKLATRFMDDVEMKECTKRKGVRHDLKVYDDDEPLVFLTPRARFNPIQETDESCDEDTEFQGFCVNINSPVNDYRRSEVEVRLLPEAAVISSSRRYETYAIALKVKAPPAMEKMHRRAPIDLVAVVDVSGKITSDELQVIKKAMRTIILSLSSSDRLSIVAFSSQSKRLLPLKRMTPTGRRSARCIVDAMTVLKGNFNSKDAVKKAVKVLLDRREKNPVATVILLSDVLDQSPIVSSTRYSHSTLDIRIHSLNLAVIQFENHMFAKCIGNLLTVVVQDLQLQLGLVSGSGPSGSSPAVIAAVYQRTPEPTVLRSSTAVIGELSANEERELLVELKLQSPAVKSDQVLTAKCRYRESYSQEIIYGKQQTLLIPHPTTVRSSSSTIQRHRNLFISARALAESRRLRNENDLTGAYHTLVSARSLLQQSNSAPDNQLMLEAELFELQRLVKLQARGKQLGRVDEKGEPLTPTSAWRVADKLAKVATMRKSVNRVSDLHGFEDARF